MLYRPVDVPAMRLQTKLPAMRAVAFGLVLVSFLQDAVAAPPTVREKVETAVAAAPPHRLRKRELRPTMKKIMRR